MIDQMSLNPRRLFLIDGLGAVVSAFLLGVVLTHFESVFGMPKNVLYFLAFLPCLFALYDLGCYLRTPENWRSFLKVIAIANLLYCCISIGFVVYFFRELSILGHLYFLGELIIVIGLVVVELKVSNS